jgi:FkbM family methyltransferase
VEVGAYDGIFVSNTWGLAERGWRGLMAEPVPDLAAACRRNHNSHPGVTVIERAVGPEDDAEVRLQLAGTLTTANPEAFREFETVDWAVETLTDQTITVLSIRLDTLLEQSNAAVGFDVLVVDVEGFEAQVFAGFDLRRWRPKMLIVELLDTHPDLSLTAQTDAGLGRTIVQAGYVVAFKDHINTVFVRDDVYAAAFNGSAAH